MLKVLLPAQKIGQRWGAIQAPNDPQHHARSRCHDKLCHNPFLSEAFMKMRIFFIVIFFLIGLAAIPCQASPVSVDDLVAQYKINYDKNETLKTLVVSLQVIEKALATLEQRYPAVIRKRQWSVRGGKTFTPIEQDTPQTGFAIGSAQYFVTQDMPRDKAIAQIQAWDELKKRSPSEWAQTMYKLFSRKHEDFMGKLVKQVVPGR
jgi:hypothetical protein